MEKEFFHHALKINEAQCIGCTHCMKTCPTEAIRVKNGKAFLYENRCVDCGECFRECPVNAIYIDHDDFNQIYNYKYRIALVPAVLIGQFPEEVKTSEIYNVMLEMGFTHVYEIEHAVDLLIEAQKAFSLQNEDVKPLISTFCPAIVRLIQVKFPSLVENLILLKSPLDIAAMYYKKKLTDQGVDENEIGLFYITPCAAKIAAVKSPVGEDVSIINGVINLDLIYNRVYRAWKQNKKNNCALPEQTQLSSKGIIWSLTDGEKNNAKGRALSIDEIHNVMEFLEKVENEEITDIDFLELRACDESCAGGVLTCGNRFLTVERLKKRAAETQQLENLSAGTEQKEIDSYKEYLLEGMKVQKIRPRSMLKLDEDISVAIKKMGRIREIIEYLPKVDCGICGSPSCQALAEDIAHDRAQLTDCVFIQRALESRGGMPLDEAMKLIQAIWGDSKFQEHYKK